MSNVLDTVFVDLVGPPVSAAWLNAVGRALSGTGMINITATAGQTTFTVPADFAGSVYINGIFQIPELSYTRPNDVTILFTQGVPYNAVVTIL